MRASKTHTHNFWKWNAASRTVKRKANPEDFVFVCAKKLRKKETVWSLGLKNSNLFVLFLILGFFFVTIVVFLTSSEKDEMMHTHTWRADMSYCISIPLAV